MSTQTIVELVGYLGSLLVLVSFLMTSVFKLRVVNTVGSLIFMVYALIIHSYPTAIMNFCLVLINLHFLWKMHKDAGKYDVVEIDPKDAYLDYFVTKQKEDIENIFPGTMAKVGEAEKAYIINCGTESIGVVYAKALEDGLELILDYTVPAYRDFSVGKFMLDKMKEKGIKRLVYRGPAEHHKAYLNKMGYVNKDDIYEKVLI